PGPDAGTAASAVELRGPRPLRGARRTSPADAGRAHGTGGRRLRLPLTPPPGTSGAADDLARGGQVAAEAEQQDGVAGAHLSPFHQLGQAERDAGGGGVAGARKSTRLDSSHVESSSA